jgi:hypothetical protein
MDKVLSFENECAELAMLQTFNPAAFIGDENVPQSLCNFVLTLALTFNDLRDLYYANVLVRDCKPEGAAQKNRHWGYYSGLSLHVTRLIMSVVHELLNLIEKQHDDVNHAFMRDVVKMLPTDHRGSWKEIVRIGLGQSSTDGNKLGKLLLKIRNNVSFHYDPKAIHKGFKNHFMTEQMDVRCYISRGDSIQSSRFYFADASVDGLLRELAREQAGNLALAFQKLLDTVCDPLILIVGAFIQKRGFAFRSEK